MCACFKSYSVILVCFYIIFCTVDYTHSSPIIVDATNSNDDWNYKIPPHSVPLLNGSKYVHDLPPVSQNHRKEESKILDKVNRVPRKLGDAVRQTVSCSLCSIGINLLDKELKRNTTFEDLKAKFVNLCVSFKVQIEVVCTGIFDVYGPEVVHVMKQITLGPQQICSMIFGETCGDVDNPLHEWTVEFPDVPKPEVTEPELPKKGVPTFKVLHITDTHYDPDYVAGSVSNCGEPLCCRNNSSPTDDDVIPAGRWGSYQKCDAPKELIMNMLHHIAEQHPDIDYILWTGDLPPHDIWNQTKERNAGIIRDTVDQMFEVFPQVPIFPSLGNHESAPAGNFPPPWVKDQDHSIYWLYSQIADQWRRWLPASVGNTVLHGGFYSVLVRPGFRIINLNTNYCHTLSWWLLLNSTDPAHELKWLIYELQEAENKGEKVHIVGHIPPGDADCLKVWSENFYKIVNRYENTIVAQFYGHNHADTYEVFYDVVELSRATNVAYLAPSVTTYENYNPAYRIYYIDGDHNGTTREVIDHETWTTNLQKANENGNEPEWYKLYSARDAYGLPSLRPREWAKLTEQLIGDSDLFDLFYKYYYRDSPVRPSCDEPKCKLQILCDLKSARSNSRHHLCHDLELEFGS